MMMGYREYARHRGVTLRAVQKAIEAGRIVVTAEKKIDADQADRDWDVNTDASRVAVNVEEKVKPASQAQHDLLSPPAAAPSGEAGADAGPEDEPAAADPNTAKYREHRTTREEYLSLKQKLEYEQLAGQLINVDDAKRIAYTSFRALRDSIMNVAARIKDQVAAESDPHACELLIETELANALNGVDISKLLSDQEE